jgi:hypothetical protein
MIHTSQEGNRTFSGDLGPAMVAGARFGYSSSLDGKNRGGLEEIAATQFSLISSFCSWTKKKEPKQ